MMQAPAQTTPGHRPNGRADSPKGTNTIQQAARWLRQTGLKDDNYDEKQWWEESDSDSDIDFEASPSRTPAVDDGAPNTPATSAHRSDDEELSLEPGVGAKPDCSPRRNSLCWHKDGYNAAYFGPIEEPSLMPAPLIIRKQRPAPKTPSPASRKPVHNTKQSSSVVQISPPEVNKPLPALPDMRVTGQMANGVKILSLAEAQARHRLAGYEVPITEETEQKQAVEAAEAVFTPQAPAQRGTTKRVILGLSKLARSTKTSSTTGSASAERLHSAPAELAPTTPTPRSPIRVGDPDRNTRCEDVMTHSGHEAPPTRPPPPPPTKALKCPCPEHRAERAAVYIVPRKPVPSLQEAVEELTQSPSAPANSCQLGERFQLSFEPDDEYEREPIVDTFVHAGHMSIHITDRVDQKTIVTHYGREERLDGDDSLEKARTKLGVYFGGKK